MTRRWSLNPHSVGIRLSWQQVLSLIGLVLALGGAWIDLRIQVTRGEDHTALVELKIDRLQQDMARLRQDSDGQQQLVNLLRDQIRELRRQRY